MGLVELICAVPPQVMVLQTLTDTAFDRAFGVASATAYRFVIGASSFVFAWAHCNAPLPCTLAASSLLHTAAACTAAAVIAQRLTLSS